MNQRETLTVVAEIIGVDAIKLLHFGYMDFEFFMCEHKHTLAQRNNT